MKILRFIQFALPWNLLLKKELIVNFHGSEWETGQYFERKELSSDRWNDVKEGSREKWNS